MTSCGNPLAGEPDLWAFGKPTPPKRPYLDLSEGKRVLEVAFGRERLIVALGLFCGLGTVEICRLKVRDLELDGSRPMMWVLGKGRQGGKPRCITFNPLACGEISPFAEGKRPVEPVYPGSYSSIDHAWRSLQRRSIGRVVGMHALRRTFGLNSLHAGVPLEELQAIYGHSSPATTADYIGVEETRMAAGVARLAEFRQSAEKNIPDVLPQADPPSEIEYYYDATA